MPLSSEAPTVPVSAAVVLRADLQALRDRARTATQLAADNARLREDLARARARLREGDRAMRRYRKQVNRATA